MTHTAQAFNSSFNSQKPSPFASISTMNNTSVVHFGATSQTKDNETTGTSIEDTLAGMTDKDVQGHFDWISSVSMPKYTNTDVIALEEKQDKEQEKYYKEVEKQKVAAEEQGKVFKPNAFTPLMMILRHNWVHGRLNKKIDKEFETKALKHLPKDIKKKLNKYKRFGYWVDRFWSGKKKAQTRLVELQGPPAIKALQARVTAKKPTIQMYKMIIKVLNDKTKLKGILESASPVQRKLAKMAKPFVLYFLQKKVNNFEVQEQLVFNATSTDIKQFSKELDAIKAKLKGTTNEIVSVGKPNRAASMAQTFIAKTTGGSDILLKFIKPGLTPEVMGDYKEYLYFKNMVDMGTTPQAKYAAAADAELNSAFLNREANLVNEFKNLEDSREQKDAMGLDSFTIPEPIAVSDDGRALAMEVAGNTVFSELSMEQVGQLLAKSGPEISAYQLLNPKIHMDFTGGNVMTTADITGEGKKKVVVLNAESGTGLIDFGRLLNMTPERHDQLMQLMQAYMSIPRLSSNGTRVKPQDYLKDANFRHAVKNFLKGSDTTYEKAVNELDALSANGPLSTYFSEQDNFKVIMKEKEEFLEKKGVEGVWDLKEQDEIDYQPIRQKEREQNLKISKAKENCQQELSDFNEHVLHLDTFLGGLLNKNKNIYEQKMASNKGEQQSEHRGDKPSLENSWGNSPAMFDVLFNTMAFNRIQAVSQGPSIKEMSELPIPYNELKDIRKKFYGSMSQYFLSPTNSDTEIANKEKLIKTLTDEENGFTDAKALFHYPEVLKDVSDYTVRHLLAALSEDDEAKFQKLGSQINKKKSKKNDLEMAYLIDKRLNQMVEVVSSQWQKKYGNMKEHTLAVFKANMAQALISDFTETIQKAKKANQFIEQ